MYYNYCISILYFIFYTIRTQMVQTNQQFKVKHFFDPINMFNLNENNMYELL